MAFKVLVVDDDVEVLNLVEKKFKDEAAEVFKAHTGQQGIDLALEKLPDLILMDIMLPDMDGAEVIRALQNRAQTTVIPVIFLSGIISRNQEEEAPIKVGNRSYAAIGKPFAFDELKLKINKVLKKNAS